MIKSVFVLFFLSILAFLSSCDDNRIEERNNTSSGNLVLSDSIIFDIDTATSTETRTFTTYYDKKSNKNYITYYDKVSRKITFIDIKERKIKFKIAINSEGKNAINYFSGFCIKNFDSIYIFSAGLKIYLINLTGDVYGVINYDTLSTGLPLVPLSSFSKFHTNAIIIDKNMYAIQGDADYHYFDINDPTKYRFCYKVNLINHRVELMNIHHPAGFWDNGVRELLVSWDYNGNSFVYSPLFSNNIYISKDNTKIDKIIDVKSKYITSIFYYNPNKVPSQEEYLEKRLTYQRYLGIMYDKYRNIYYRFFWPGIDITNMTNEGLWKAYKEPPVFGISVLDKDFNIITETVLPANTYTTGKCFVTEKGLAIPADHPGNPNIKEDKWCFHIFSLIPQ